MFRRPKKFVATPEAPFENDKLDRADSIKNLSNLMATTDTPMVMTVSAPWGSGKSSFVQMWKAYLEGGQAGKKHPCIMFDAWKHDFHKEPLLAVMGEIGAFIAENAAAKRGEKIIKGCMEHLPKLLKASAGLAYLASPFIPGMGLTKDVLEKTASAVKDIDKYVFEGHADQKESLRLFKVELEKFVQKVTKNGVNGPLYFFVDELDRCDPEYAIKLLESVKHFFDVKGIVFVLSVDRDKLGSMVRVRYGEHYDADGYLKRFVDVDYEISEPTFINWVEYLIADVLRLEGRPIAADTKQFHQLVEFVAVLAQELGMRARDVEKTLVKLSPFLTGSFSVLDERCFNPNSQYSLHLSELMFWHVGAHSFEVNKYLNIESLDNFYHVFLIVAFLKEVNREHYDTLMGWDWFGRELPDFLKGSSQSTCMGILCTLLEGKARQLVSREQEIENQLSADCVDAWKIAFMLGCNEGYWSKCKVIYKAQLENLNGISLLASESLSGLAGPSSAA